MNNLYCIEEDNKKFYPSYQQETPSYQQETPSYQQETPSYQQETPSYQSVNAEFYLRDVYEIIQRVETVGHRKPRDNNDEVNIAKIVRELKSLEGNVNGSYHDTGILRDIGNVNHSESVARGRFEFSESQKIFLENVFLKSKYVNAQERKTMALTLNLRDDQVKNWFQNKRSKLHLTRTK
ncbi:NK1 transcription factor-related protein 1-like [Gordionus sp. m RMFG-2023]|uniref:NK1 transcription factor-related protein 1-like n=1 Tax=Gordionus sp. m RMFG-2023 TaxID=3053472 RepID=UPI0031FCD493